MSLLARCRELTAATAQDQEPVRILHHFACTGGTLISKCLAVMPNTLVLSEIDPFSSLPLRKSNFAPTDLIKLLKSSGREIDPELIGAVFLAGLTAIKNHSQDRGIRLVLRDHSHSQFCVGGVPRLQPSMGRLLKNNFEVISVVTVRHPIDSYLSLIANEWVHFEPKTFEEYCKRYLIFLDHHRDAKLYSYESFVEEPLKITASLCTDLQLKFNADSLESYSAFSLTGDSGRSSDQIKPRPRRDIPNALLSEILASASYRGLCEKLDYEIEVA
ncbi:MAG: sulfotransferase family protein [Verrucomicrobiota bacterium]